jgi:hypothetical protein
VPAFAVSRPQPQLWIGTSTTRRSIWSILELQVLVDALKHDPDVTVVVFDSAIVDHVLAPYDMGRASETPALPARPGCRRVWTPPSARRFVHRCHPPRQPRCRPGQRPHGDPRLERVQGG